MKKRRILLTIMISHLEKNVNVQCISRCHKKFIENNNDYLSCFYETDIQIPLHYVVGVDQHVWNTNSVYSIFLNIHSCIMV